MMLDATAGNRAMWPNKNPPNVIFMDKEIGLFVPPHLFCDWRYLPFRDKVFKTILFDPPHDVFSKGSVHMNPKGWNEPRLEEGRKIGGTFWGSLDKSWAGIFHKAQREFRRVASRLCLKWNDSEISLERVLLRFPDWRIIQINEYQTNMRRGNTLTWWVTFICNSEGS